MRTVLCGVGGLAAALRATAGGDCWTSHLDGFVSNYRGELFTLHRTERDKQALEVEASIISHHVSQSLLISHRVQR